MTLKIEAGKFYRTRDGRKVGPMNVPPSWGDWVKSIHADCVDADGYYQGWTKLGLNGFEDHSDPLDLIAEWTDTHDTTTPPLAPTDPYAPLRRVLDAAYDQAANGKGKERHANNKPFTDQPIMEIARMVGPGYQLGQAMKKAQEAGGMIQRGQPDRARAELLGAINYLAACVLLIEEAAK